MTRKSMRSALSASLEAEDEAVRSRFEKAESLLGEKPQVSEQPVVASPVAKRAVQKGTSNPGQFHLAVQRL